MLPATQFNVILFYFMQFDFESYSIKKNSSTPPTENKNHHHNA